MAKLTDAMIDNTTEKIMEAQANWLEDVLAGLLINGVSVNDVDVQYHPDNRIVVAVDGVPKYTCSIMLQG